MPGKNYDWMKMPDIPRMGGFVTRSTLDEYQSGDLTEEKINQAIESIRTVTIESDPMLPDWFYKRYKDLMYSRYDQDPTKGTEPEVPVSKWVLRIKVI